MQWPQDIVYTGEQERFNDALASLWGAGSVVAAYAYWNELEKAEQAFETIQRDYGTWPHLQLSPNRNYDGFYPRDSAHVLWGLAVYMFL